MKRTIKAIPITICAAAFCAVVLAGPSAQANAYVTGSIGFGAAGVIVNNPILADATSFSVISPLVNDPYGTYAPVPLGTPVDFNGFVFNPPVASIIPLWTFTYDSTVYSFDATSDSSFFNAVLDEWDIGGKGIAMVTGFSPTDGTWNVNLSQSGATFVFDSSEAANGTSVTDGGSSMALLGSGFIFLGAFGRRCRL